MLQSRSNSILGNSGEGSKLAEDLAPHSTPGRRAGSSISGDPPCPDWPESDTTRVLQAISSSSNRDGSFRLFPYRAAASELSESERVRESERPGTRRAWVN